MNELDALLEDVPFDSNDPMVRDAAKAITLAAVESGARMEIVNIAFIATRFAEAAIKALEEEGWI